MTDEIKTVACVYLDIIDLDMVGMNWVILKTNKGGYIPIEAKYYDKIGRPIRGDKIRVDVRIEEKRKFEP